MCIDRSLDRHGGAATLRHRFPSYVLWVVCEGMGGWRGSRWPYLLSVSNGKRLTVVAASTNSTPDPASPVACDG